MKLQNLNQNDTMVKDQKLETYITDEDKKIRSGVREKAARDAENNLPKEGQPLKAYRYAIETAYQNLYQYVAKELQAREQNALNKHDSSFVEQKQKENKQVIADKIHERQSHLIEVNRIPDSFDRSKISWVYLILIVVWLFNGIVDAKALMNGLHENFLISLIWGLLLSGGGAGLSKVTPWVMDEWTNSKIQRIALAIGSIALVFVITFIIGTFRSAGASVTLATATTNTVNAGSPLIFAIINSFIYIVELFICMFFLPNKAQEQQYAAKKKHLDKVKQLESEIEALKKENTALTEELNTVVKIRMQNAFYENYLKDYIQSLYESAWGLYLSENVIRRRDNYTPLEEDIPSLFNQKNSK